MGMPGLLGNRTYSDPDNIGELLSLIHDEFFEVEKVTLDKATKTLNVPFYRCFHGENEKVLRKRIIWTVYEVPVLNCLLKIRNVESYSLYDNDKFGLIDFNLIEYLPEYNALKIETCIPSTFQATISNFRIEYSEIGFGGRAEITHGLFWQSGPKFLDI